MAFLVRWIAVDPTTRQDRVESAKEACHAALINCLPFVLGLDLAAWCAVATSSQLTRDGITLDHVLSPSGWNYPHCPIQSLYQYCLSLPIERLELWESEWVAAGRLWSELHDCGLEWNVDDPTLKLLRTLRSRAQDTLLILHAALARLRRPFDPVACEV